MLTRNRLSSTSCRAVLNGDAHQCGKLRSDHSEVKESGRSTIIRTNSIGSPYDLPPKIEEDDLEILGVLDKGAFGRTLKVKHNKLNCVLVLKEVLQERKEDEEAIVREISLLRHLKHPNVLTCFGVVIRNKHLGFVTEFIEKGSLHKLYITPVNVSFNWNKIISFARDIALGMGYLHENDVIHRDLTTHNCLVRHDDSVVVADFGLSKFVQPTSAFNYSPFKIKKSSIIDSTLPETQILDSLSDRLSTECQVSIPSRLKTRTRTSIPRRHTVVGSPYWMAPEMLAGQPYDNSVDVYSFGVILCQLMARCDADPDLLPRNAKSMSVDMNEFFEIHELPSNIPTLMLELASKCVHELPNERPNFDYCAQRFDEWLLYSTKEEIALSSTTNGLLSQSDNQIQIMSPTQ